jgi:hypothetical protein
MLGAGDSAVPERPLWNADLCAFDRLRGRAHQEGRARPVRDGTYHDLYEPQRLSMLTDRLEEFVPASCDAAVVFVT